MRLRRFAAFIPRDKPKLFVICVGTFDVLMTLLFLIVACLYLQLYSLANFVYLIAVAGIPLLVILGAACAIRKIFGYYRHVEPKPRPEQIW